MADEKFRFPSTTMDPLTQICRGSVIDTFPLGPPGTFQNPILCFFIMADKKFRFPSTTMDPLTQFVGGGGGVLIDTFPLGPPGSVQNPNFVFFHNSRQEISISVNNDGPLDPNLWGVSNLHFSSRTTRDLSKTQFCVFS